MSCLTAPVDDVPSYDAMRTNEISQGVVMPRMRSAAKTNEPLSTARNSGCWSFKSSLICAATCATRFLIFSSGMETENCRSRTIILSMICIMTFTLKGWLDDALQTHKVALKVIFRLQI